MQDEKPVPPTLEEAFPKDALSIAFLVKAYVEAREKSKQWEVVAANYQVAMQKNMDEAGVKSFTHEGASVTRVLDGLTKRLDKNKLMRSGVSADVIDACSVEVKRTGYVRVETPEQKAQRSLVAGGMRSDASD